MKLGLLKIVGILSFGAGCFIGVFPGECWRAKSFKMVTENPIAAVASLVIEAFFVWIFIDVMKRARGEKPMTVDKVSTQFSGRNAEGLGSYRICFLLGVVANILGLAAGVYVTLTRYQR